MAKAKAAAESISARCAACNATGLEVLRIVNHQDYAGIGPDGKRYTSIVRRRVRCRHCGKHQMAIAREYDPKRWK